MVFLSAKAQTFLVTNNTSSELVAIVDDDQSVLNALRDLMESAELSASCFFSAEEFLESDHRSQTACLIADVGMTGMSGLELQSQLNAEGSRIPIIFITARGDGRTQMEAMAAGAVAFLSKPFDDDVLLEKVRQALRR
jgi:FixJ family two-component response regulator